MTLRTTALIGGALGLLLLIGGLIATALSPDTVATPGASVTTDAVLVDPDLIATVPTATLEVKGEGDIAAFVARTEDAQAWAQSRDVAVATAIPDWETVTLDQQTATVSTSPTPGASASSSATPSDSPSPSASPTPSDSPSPSASPEDAPSETPIADIWRQDWQGSDSLAIDLAQVPVGTTLVLDAGEDATISAITFTVERQVDDAWIAPLTWWGGVLTVVGLIALAGLIVDIRATRSRGEERAADKKVSPPAVPGSRRARREEAATTGSIPVIVGSADAVETILGHAPDPGAPGRRDADDGGWNQPREEDRP